MPTGVPRRRTKNLTEHEIAQWNRQRTETQKQLAEKYRLENQITRSQYLDRADLEKGLYAIAAAIKDRIMSSKLEHQIKVDILKELSSIPLAIEDVARGQTRLKEAKAGKNGKGRRG